MKGINELAQGRVTLRQVVDLYLKHRTPRKSTTEQQADKRQTELWKKVLGASRDPHKVTLGEWERFIDARRGGAINAHGKAVPPGKRRPVRVRPVEADCRWLRLLSR